MNTANEQPAAAPTSTTKKLCYFNVNEKWYSKRCSINTSRLCVLCMRQDTRARENIPRNDWRRRQKTDVNITKTILWKDVCVCVFACYSSALSFFLYYSDSERIRYLCCKKLASENVPAMVKLKERKNRTEHEFSYAAAPWQWETWKENNQSIF